MMNTRRTQNRPPTGLSLPNGSSGRTSSTRADTDENELDANFGVSDPDMHALQYRWALADGTVVSTFPFWDAASERREPTSDCDANDRTRGIDQRHVHAGGAGRSPRRCSSLGRQLRLTSRRMAGGGRPDGGRRLPCVASRQRGAKSWRSRWPIRSIISTSDSSPIRRRSTSCGSAEAKGTTGANDSVFLQFHGCDGSRRSSYLRDRHDSALAVNLKSVPTAASRLGGWKTTAGAR